MARQLKILLCLVLFAISDARIPDLRKLLEKFVTEPLIELILNDEFKSDFLFSAIILD